MAYRVFISSTRLDLETYVGAVDQALRRQQPRQFELVMNEYWTARGDKPVEACEKEVLEADLFVGIYGWRYGFVPAGASESITERELLTAQYHRKPIRCFLVADSTPSPEGLEEESEDAVRRLEELKDRVKPAYVVNWFKDPTDLALKVITTLDNWKSEVAGAAGELQYLLALWKTVHDTRIQAVLSPEFEERRIDIEREELPDLVGPHPSVAGRAADLALPMEEIFHRRNRKLLILGAPGAGKSTALLELARGLGRLASSGGNPCIPVIFNLSSWDGDQDLGAWMADQLVAHYSTGTQEAPKWVAENRILPLLDGLEEIGEDCRKRCVDKINDFLKERGYHLLGMAVCCDTDVYRDLPRLNLIAAMGLCPLTPEQVGEHLATRGPALADLRNAIAKSRQLLELASSPLFLDLLAETYRGVPAEEIGARQADEVLARYVEKAFAAGGRRHPPLVACRILSWLARGMAEHHQTLLLIERLQPSWLGTRSRVWAYALISRALGGALLALPLAWIFRATGLFLLLLALGFLGGGLAGALDATELARQAEGPRSRTRRFLRRAVPRGFLIAAGVALAVPLAASLWLQWLPSGLDNPGADARNLRRAAAFLIPVLGLIFGSRGARRHRNHDVHVAEKLSWGKRKWSWRGSRVGAVWGAVTGLALSVIGAFLDGTLSYFPPPLWLLLFLAFGLLGAVTGGTVGAVRAKPIDERLRPNRGTWLSLENAGWVALGVALAATAAFALFRGASAWALASAGGGGGFRSRDFYGALEGGLALGSWMGLWFSGLDFIQHFTLRGVLWSTRKLPARLVPFLNYARDRGVLRRPGRSYEFRHSLLLQHLARWQEPAPRGRHGQERRGGNSRRAQARS